MDASRRCCHGTQISLGAKRKALDGISPSQFVMGPFSWLMLHSVASLQDADLIGNHESGAVVAGLLKHRLMALNLPGSRASLVCTVGAKTKSQSDTPLPSLDQRDVHPGIESRCEPEAFSRRYNRRGFPRFDYGLSTRK